MSVRTSVTTAAVAAAGLLALGGAALAIGTAQPPTVQAAPAAQIAGATPTSSATSTPTTTPSAAPGAQDAAIPVERAREIAVAYVGGGTVTKVETEIEHGRLEWKVEVRNAAGEHDVRVDAGTGEVTRTDSRGATGGGPIGDTGGRDDGGRDDGGRDDGGTATAPAPAPAPQQPGYGPGYGDDHPHGDDDGRHGGDDGRHGGDDDGGRHGGGDHDDDDHGGNSGHGAGNSGSGGGGNSGRG